VGSKDDRGYLKWAYAGGPNECRHGYAAGIPCPDCDAANAGASEKRLTEIEHSVRLFRRMMPQMPHIADVVESLCRELRAAEAELTRLRAWAEQVPHDLMCNSPIEPCNCIKSKLGGQ
jgi:hypothetical protein